MGVVHGIKAFVPRMIAGGEDGIIVNTASVGGLSTGPFQGPYVASKFAVVAITEVLQAELSILHPTLRAACLCPGEVSTQIFRSERLRPNRFGTKAGSSQEVDGKFHDWITSRVEDEGITPAELAERVFAALTAGKFWVFPHPRFKEVFDARHKALMRDEALPVRLPREVAGR
jgi:short-subunit dehydrogenase